MNINLDASIARAKVIASNNKYGYSQTRRDEEFETDCSQGTVDCLNAGGFNFSLHLTTDTMLKPLLAAGFVDVTNLVDLKTGKGLLPADVCLRPKTKTRGGHVILVLKADGAEILQNAGDFDGKPGDSSGKEICIVPFYPSPFKYALRYPQSETGCPYAEPIKVYLPRKLFTGEDARWFEWQLLRIGHTPESIGCTENLDAYETDGIAGPKTWAALGFEISQGQKYGRVTNSLAGEQFREYLKSVPSKQ